MDLSRFFSAVPFLQPKKEPDAERFLAIKISKTHVLVAVWQVLDKRVKIGKVQSEKIPGEKFEDLLTAVDLAVSAATAEAQKTSKSIFAVPVEYIVDGKIVPDELSKLRKICKELDLYPLGYVNPPDALLEYFKEVEGAPLSAILIGLDGRKISLAIFRAGKEIGSKTLERDETKNLSIPVEIENGLKQFGHMEALPSRIILYDGEADLSQVANEITAYPWTSRLPFLHFPKVEKVSSEFVVSAVAVAGGLQMGGKMDAMEHVEESLEKEVPGEPFAQEAEFVEVSAEEAGFELSSPQKQVINPPMSTPSEAQKEKRPLRLPKMPTIKFPGAVPKLAIIFLIFFLILGVGLAMSVYLIPKVSVITKVDAQEFDREMTVGVLTGGNAESEDSIPGNFVQRSEVGTKRSATSGSKLVGKKAAGKVTIYSVAEGKNFSSGTVLTSPSGLKFTLDKDAVVASGDAASAATVTVPVTASTIGDSFNLGSGTKFSVGNLPSNDYLAKNESAFAGGESHMAKVVTKADMDRLMATLSAELSEKALSGLRDEIGSSQTLLPNAVTSTVSKKKFSKGPDEEADTVSLDLSMDFKGVVFAKDDAIEFFKRKFAGEVPSGYVLIPADTEVTVVSTEIDEKKETSMTLKVDSAVMPEIDSASLAAKLSGKNEKTATKIISELPGFRSVKFAVSPPIFAPIMNFALPFKKGNIKILVVRD